MERVPDHFKNNFDLIRLAAALQVACGHTLLWLDVAKDLNYYILLVPGVPVFFFISGYLVFPSLKRSRTVVEFYIKRALRIYPALWVCFGVTVLMVVATGYFDWRLINSQPFVEWARAQLSFFQYEQASFLGGFGVGTINGSLWTISTELQFYILTPVIASIVAWRRSAWPILIGLFVVANIYVRPISMGTPITNFLATSFIPWIYMFLFGAWLSSRPDIVRLITHIPLWALIVAYFGTQQLSKYMGFGYRVNHINPVLFFLLSAVVLRLAYLRPYLSFKILRGNDISYGVYIYHMLVVNLFLFLGLRQSYFWTVVALMLTVCLGAASWWFVERPILSLKPKDPMPRVSDEAGVAGPQTGGVASGSNALTR